MSNATDTQTTNDSVSIDADCSVFELPTIHQLGTRDFCKLLSSRLQMEWLEPLHAIPVARGWAYVIGDSDIGRYEWAFNTEPNCLVFSNAGYGAIAEALRDCLIAACGQVVLGRGIDRMYF